MQLLKKIFGDLEEFPLSQRVFHIVCVILIFASLAGTAVNLLLRMPDQLSLITALFVVFPISFLYLSYKLNRFRLAYNLFFVVGYLFIVIIWFYNAGLNGYIHLLLFSLITWQMVFTESKDVFWFILNLVIGIFLASVELLFPNVILWEYQSKDAKILDFIFTYLIMGVSTFFIVRALVVSYRNERKRVVEVNKELVDVNQKLVESIKQLEMIDQTKSKLFSVISHDVRSFAGSIQNFSELLVDQLQNKTDSKEHIYAKYLHDSSKKLNTVLFNLLSWTRIQMDAINILPENFVLETLISREISLYEYEIRDKKQDVKVNVDQRHIVFADDEMVASIFRNILSNALKFTKMGGEIVISSAIVDKMVELKVSDNGIGISKENIEILLNDKIFYSQSGTNNEKGIGLGIRISKSFAEMNKGYLKIESTPRVGSTFILGLPVGQLS